MSHEIESRTVRDSRVPHEPLDVGTMRMRRGYSLAVRPPDVLSHRGGRIRSVVDSAPCTRQSATSKLASPKPCNNTDPIVAKVFLAATVAAGVRAGRRGRGMPGPCDASRPCDEPLAARGPRRSHHARRT